MHRTWYFVMLVGALSGAVAASDPTPVAINLSPGYTSYSPLPAHQPSIAAHGRNIAVLYRRSSLIWDVYSADGGESFSKPKRFIHAPAFGSSLPAEAPIARSGVPIPMLNAKSAAPPRSPSPV